MYGQQIVQVAVRTKPPPRALARSDGRSVKKTEPRCRIAARGNVVPSPGGNQQGSMTMKEITTFLWFDKEAEEAAAFYTSIFPNSRIGDVVRNPGDSPAGPAGIVLLVEFELDGRPFVGLNGGPHFKFSEAVSLHLSCDSQEEIDHYWEKLMEGGGTPQQCGWLKDRFGFSWQVDATRLVELMKDPDRDKANRAMQAMLKMIKIDIAEVERAIAA
jgi:predicted 3-demethylubiquinone-9 3-methyltransferase (glyoxalase superfamily)